MEGVYQFGRFGPGSISAWTVATEAGFTFEAAALKPRLGLKADIASGNGDLDDDTLGTFNALYPKQPYFSQANLATPANIADIHPSFEFELLPDLTLGLGAIFTGGSARYIGTQMVADTEWQVWPQLTLGLHYVHFQRGGVVRQAGGYDVNFLAGSAALTF